MEQSLRYTEVYGVIWQGTDTVSFLNDETFSYSNWFFYTINAIPSPAKTNSLHHVMSTVTYNYHHNICLTTILISKFK